MCQRSWEWATEGGLGVLQEAMTIPQSIRVASECHGYQASLPPTPFPHLPPGPPR